MSIETVLQAWARPSPPALPVVTVIQSLAERIERLLVESAPHSSELVELRAMLSNPLQQLWAIHIVGPNNEHPMLNREHAEKTAAHTIERCAELLDGVKPAVNVIPSPWVPEEHFEILAQELLEESERLRHGWGEVRKRVEAEKVEQVEARALLSEFAQHLAAKSYSDNDEGDYAQRADMALLKRVTKAIKVKP